MPKELFYQRIPAKILLFGEYAVLYDGNGLAIPLEMFQTFWATGNDSSANSLVQLYEYLEELNPPWLDLTQWKRDLNHNIFLASNIPRGKGLGSSGAVTAAVFQRYGTPLRETDELSILVNRLKLIENFYHGNSSGFDPLVSYLNKIVYKEGDHFIPRTELRYPKEYHLFLLDSGITRNSKRNIDFIRKQLRKNVKYIQFIDEYIPLNNRIINHLLNGQNSYFVEDFEQVSRLQYKLFADLIPEVIKPVWNEGLKEKHFLLKLCGAGGGGFFWGIKKNDFDLSARIDFPTIRFDNESRRGPDNFH